MNDCGERDEDGRVEHLIEWVNALRLRTIRRDIVPSERDTSGDLLALLRARLAKALSLARRSA